MYLVSACLAGFPCRWDGKTMPDEKIVELIKKGEAIPICPEQLGGLTTPREPSEISGYKVLSKIGTDVTLNFTKGAETALQIAKKYGCKKAILKAKSPSCGKGKVYDGTFSGKMIDGNGMTAELLIKNGIEVLTENEI